MDKEGSMRLDREAGVCLQGLDGASCSRFIPRNVDADSLGDSWPGVVWAGVWMRVLEILPLGRSSDDMCF